MRLLPASFMLALSLTAALAAATPAAADAGAEILAITTNALDCTVDVVFRVEDAADYFVNMWDDGVFHAGAGSAVAAGAIGRVRFTIGGLISQSAAGIGLYVENGVGPSGASVTYDSSGSTQAWSDQLGTACQAGGYSAAVVSESHPEGTKLALKSGSKPGLSLQSNDARISTGRGAGSADDPTLNGGSLRVLSEGGELFDTTYPLASGGWTALSGGFRFQGGGAITSVSVTDGKSIKIKGSGVGLGHDLSSDPEAVVVELTLGERRYCMRFGGATSFVPEESFDASGAPADDWSCPAP